MAKRTAATIREVVMRSGWGALVAFAGVSGCSGPPAVATAYMNTTATCSAGGEAPVTLIGEIGSPLPETSPDGTVVGGHPIQVQCSVSGSGSNFSIRLYANDNSDGNTTLFGPATYASGSNAGGSGIDATFVTTQTGAVYTGSNCVLTYSFNGQSTLPNNAVGIQSGLIWGHVSCPSATDQGMDVTGDGGEMVQATCDVESDFLFENCTE